MTGDESGLSSALGQWFENQSLEKLLKCGVLGPFPDLPKHGKPGVWEFSGPRVIFKKYVSFIAV